MVQYCLELPNGKFRHFPAGTYNEQTKKMTGRIELNLMSIVHSVWYAFGVLSMSKWGESESKAAKLAEPLKPKPEKPTRKLDECIKQLWAPYSFWQHYVMWQLWRTNTTKGN